MTAKLKVWLAGAGALVLAILIGLAIYGGHYKRLASEAIGVAKQMKVDETATLAKHAASDLIKDAEKAALEQEKNKALADKAIEHAGRIKSDSDLAAEKAKTAALPPDTLSGNINIRIGAGQSWPTEGGVFIFTRLGAENTFNHFLNEEAVTEKYQSALREIEDDGIAYTVLENQKTLVVGQLVERTDERDKAILRADKNADAVKYIQRSILWTKTKSFLIGAGVGAAIVFILKITGTI